MDVCVWWVWCLCTCEGCVCVMVVHVRCIQLCDVRWMCVLMAWEHVWIAMLWEHVWYLWGYEHKCDMCDAMRTCVICAMLWKHVWCYENMCDTCDDCWFLHVWPLVVVTVIICVGPLITGYSTLPLYVYVLVDIYLNTWAVTFPLWACLDSYVCGTRM